MFNIYWQTRYLIAKAFYRTVYLFIRWLTMKISPFTDKDWGDRAWDMHEAMLEKHKWKL